MNVPAHVTRMMFRALRFADVHDIVQHLQFHKLRQRYYDLFWARVGQELGADVRKWDGYTRLTRNGTAVIVHGPDVRLDDHLTLKLMGNKALTYELLAEQGLAVPHHVRFSVMHPAGAYALLGRGVPLVVKPNFGTGGGRGVTTGITTRASLRTAAIRAARFDTDLIAEEQIEGQSWRLLFVDGKFLDAVRRDPPRITGDGMRSIRELVKAENARRLSGRPFTALSPIRIDRELTGYLAAQELSPRSVPSAGEMVVLKRAVNENDSSQNHSLSGMVHPATLAACSALARNLGVRLAGIDIIARDLSRPLNRDNGMIGEVNTTPGLHHHDLVSTQRHGLSVAAMLVEHMFESNSGTIVLPQVQGPALPHRMAAE